MLHIIDNEKVVHDSIAWLAASRDVAVAPYDSGETFLAAINSKRTFDTQGECLLLDVQAPLRSGTAVFDALTLRNLMRRLPVIFLVGHGESQIAADVVKRGAFDFFEKPFNGNKLMDRVEEALSASRLVCTSDAIQSRLASLSAREKEVLDLILEGHMNKVIGDKLGISRRTVEAHRANIFYKTNVKNAMELARLLK